jgi:Ca2+/Na+ antiporter
MLIAFHQFTAQLFSIYTLLSNFCSFRFFTVSFYEKKGRRVIYLVNCCIYSLCIVNYFLFKIKSSLIPIRGLQVLYVLIVYSMLFILKQNNEEQNWGDNIYNWINAGILLYLASCLFMFIFSNYLLSAGDHINKIVWGIHDTILIIEYILFAVGFYKCKTQQIISTY